MPYLGEGVDLLLRMGELPVEPGEQRVQVLHLGRAEQHDVVLVEPSDVPDGTGRAGCRARPR